MTSGAAASRYARALFDVLLKERGDLEKAETDLAAFASLLSQHAVLGTTLRNPAIPVAKKKAVVEALLARAGSVSPVVSKMILLLAERDRLRLHQQVIRGEVTTAMPIDADKLRALEQGFATATGRRVVLESKVDPSIIGGVVTRLGSTVYDGSVTTQLQKMKQSLIEAGQ